jgi:hypothetical protein
LFALPSTRAALVSVPCLEKEKDGAEYESVLAQRERKQAGYNNLERCCDLLVQGSCA